MTNEKKKIVQRLRHYLSSLSESLPNRTHAIPEDYAWFGCETDEALLDEFLASSKSRPSYKSRDVTRADVIMDVAAEMFFG